MVCARCSMPASERPVLSSNGRGVFVWVYEGGLRYEEGAEDEGSEIIPCTVASSFPLSPNVGDHMSSSISRSLVIASIEGASDAPERVFVKIAVGCERTSEDKKDGCEISTNLGFLGQILVLV